MLILLAVSVGACGTGKYPTRPPWTDVAVPTVHSPASQPVATRLPTDTAVTDNIAVTATPVPAEIFRISPSPQPVPDGSAVLLPSRLSSPI